MNIFLRGNNNQKPSVFSNQPVFQSLENILVILMRVAPIVSYILVSHPEINH